MTTLWQKAETSAVDCGVILFTGALIAPVAGPFWKVATVMLCLWYNMIFADRSPGMMLARTYSLKPADLTYIMLYTTGFCSILFYYRFPFDLLVPYVLLQIACVHYTGRTIPGYLTGNDTMTRSEFIASVKGRAREYVGQGDYKAAIAVMVADLARVDIRSQPELTSWALFAATERNETDVIKFIEGFPDE
jgi:hypothetical protein